MSFQFTATKGVQGGKIYYVANVTFGALSRVLAIDSGDVMERSQREIEKPRATKIQSYLNENRESYVLPALTGIVEDPNLLFEEFGHAGSGVGLLSLSLDAEIKLFDGQHRATGIRQVIKQNNYMKNDQIALQLFVGMDLLQRQQAFSDINSNAKQVSKSLNLAYSHRDKNVQPIVTAIDHIYGWAGRIDYENNTVPKDSENIFSLRNIVQACRIHEGCSKNQMLARNAYLTMSRYWNDIGTTVGWFVFEDGAVKQIPRSEGMAAENIFFTVAGLMVLARVGQKVGQLPGYDPDRMKLLNTVLRQVGQHRDSPFWRGNIIKENGNMDASTKAQITGADAIMELLSKALSRSLNS